MTRPSRVLNWNGSPRESVRQKETAIASGAPASYVIQQTETEVHVYIEKAMYYFTRNHSSNL